MQALTTEVESITSKHTMTKTVTNDIMRAKKL